MIYPEDAAEVKWNDVDLVYSIVRHKQFSHYCGYVRFPKRELTEQGYDGIGITYAEEHEDGSMVYGFDCMHAGDENNPRCSDIDWLKQECEKMGICLTIAAKYEERFLLAKTEEDKATVLDEFHEDIAKQIGATFDLSDNFGAMVRVMGGDL
ncbi:hypothetical protein [Methanococcoides sp. AM1]|uniref:hypothetical protein n=1 Tax=Methanococcoides sp. AM1 TaxID=1201011 RepID=UPI001083A458|nr:hypothetical protein [Methanococcoides sp. AM1]